MTPTAQRLNRAAPPPSRSRSLTAGEWRAIHPGLVRALETAGARPTIVGRAHPAARIAAIWRGGVPVLTRRDAIWWPAAPDDLSHPGFEHHLAILQHELQHVLDYRTGRLSAFTYLTRPSDWRYDYSAHRHLDWSRLGAEQRASLAGRLWLVEHGLAPARERAFLEARIPWAAYSAAASAGGQVSALSATPPATTATPR